MKRQRTTTNRYRTIANYQLADVDPEQANVLLHRTIQDVINKTLGTLAHHRHLKLSSINGNDPRTYCKYSQCETRSYAIGIFCTHLRSDVNSKVLDQIIPEGRDRSGLNKMFEPEFWSEIGVPKKWATTPMKVAIDWTIDLAMLRRMCDQSCNPIATVDFKASERLASEALGSAGKPMYQDPKPRIPVLDDRTLDEEIKDDLKEMGSSIDTLRMILDKTVAPLNTIKGVGEKVDRLLETA